MFSGKDQKEESLEVTLCYCDAYHLMGCSPSSDESEYEEYVVPWNEQWRHGKCTVRAPHQLIILDKPGYCDFCRRNI